MRTHQEKLAAAEKRVKELFDSGAIKRLSQESCMNISQFYETKSKNRLETALLISLVSSDVRNKQTYDVSQDYADYGEAVAAAYYAMYYIVHAYLAKLYGLQIQEHTRGIHAITHHLVLYYLVKTEKLTKHLYEEYVKTLETTAELQKITLGDFKEEAFSYAQKYERSRDVREVFTYAVAKSAEARHASTAIQTAREFIGTVREIMLKQ